MKDTLFERIADSHSRTAKTLTMVQQRPHLVEPEHIDLLTQILQEYEQAVRLSDSDS